MSAPMSPELLMAVAIRIRTTDHESNSPLDLACAALAGLSAGGYVVVPKTLQAEQEAEE